MAERTSIAHRARVAAPYAMYLPALVVRHPPVFRKSRAVPPYSPTAQAAPETGFDAIVGLLGIDMEMETDPDVVNSILRDDMLLDDFPGKEAIFGEKLERPWSAAAFLASVRTGFLAREPLAEYSREAVERGLIPPPNPQILHRAIHHTILLDDLTRAMADDPQLMDDLLAFLMRKREDKFGVPPKFPKNVRRLREITGSVFEVAKIVTMDWVFAQYAEIRERGIEDLPKRQLSLGVNIVEALLTENGNGFKPNALTGVALALNPFSDAWVTDDGRRFIKYKLDARWTDLYESWNLAFVTGNEENLHLIYTKLFIPSVIGAPHDDYLFNRALSLWATAQFVIFWKAATPKRPDYQMPGSEELAAPWGEMNARYAEAYVREHNHADLRSRWSMFKVLLRKIF